MDLILSSALVIKDRSILLLHRTDHDHYETPGGKLDPEDCEDPTHPSQDDMLRCALRELNEEVDCVAEPFSAPIEHRFTVRDGREAYVAKFPMRFISGSLAVREPVFNHARFVGIEELDTLRLSPDLDELIGPIRTLIDSTTKDDEHARMR